MFLWSEHVFLWMLYLDGHYFNKSLSQISSGPNWKMSAILILETQLANPYSYAASKWQVFHPIPHILKKTTYINPHLSSKYYTMKDSYWCSHFSANCNLRAKSEQILSKHIWQWLIHHVMAVRYSRALGIFYVPHTSWVGSILSSGNWVPLYSQLVCVCICVWL